MHSQRKIWRQSKGSCFPSAGRRGFFLDRLRVNNYNVMHSTLGSRHVAQWITQFRKGLVELCIMAALRDEEAYGYQIVEKLGAVAGLEVMESTVYPVLARLARDRCVTVRSAPSPSGPPRRYYRLSEAGRRRFSEMLGHWQSIQNSVNQLTQGALP